MGRFVEVPALQSRKERETSWFANILEQLLIKLSIVRQYSDSANNDVAPKSKNVMMKSSLANLYKTNLKGIWGW